jgi:hypothetical protein
VGQRHVIVWDLDGTLGDFTELERQPKSIEPICLQLRPGLDKALRQLSAAGFIHTVLTVATKPYADLVLHGTGLADHFALVEGRSERPKGDAAGIAAHFGIAEADRPHGMFFVGDRLMFDQPADPQIVFHLELWALTRPAEELARLLLHLRDLGNGSVRQGFDRIGRNRIGWRRYWPWSEAMPVDKPVRRTLPRVAPLLFLARTEDCPVIGFEKPPEPESAPEECRMIPTDVEARLVSSGRP